MPVGFWDRNFRPNWARTDYYEKIKFNLHSRVIAYFVGICVLINNHIETNGVKRSINDPEAHELSVLVNLITLFRPDWSRGNVFGDEGESKRMKKKEGRNGKINGKE